MEGSLLDWIHVKSWVPTREKETLIMPGAGDSAGRLPGGRGRQEGARRRYQEHRVSGKHRGRRKSKTEFLSYFRTTNNDGKNLFFVGCP